MYTALMLRRFFGKHNGDDDGAVPAPSAVGFTISYSSGRTLRAARVEHGARPESVIDALGLAVPRPVIFLMSGAARMDSDSMSLARTTIEDGLGRFAESQHVNVIDGGTTSGGMAIIGLARFRRGYRFPLIGVAPESCVAYPGFANPQRQADIDAFHSHIVLTSGAAFGDESDMLLWLARAISGYGTLPALGVIVNGGEIVQREAHRCATGQTPDGSRLPLLVLEGSGRFADDLAAAHKARQAGRHGTAILQQPILREILEQGSVDFLSVKAGADQLRLWLERFFNKA
jgi:hypothetical protein